MKQATCRDLKGACDEVTTGHSPEEMAENSRQHVMAAVKAGDEAHFDAMEEMKQMSAEDQQQWYQDFVTNFVSLTDA